MNRVLRTVAVGFAVSILLGCVSTGPKQSSDEQAAARRQEAEQYYSFGADYYHKRNYDAAMENARQSLATDSSYYEPYILIGNIWRKRRDPIQAEEAYRKAMAIDPGRAKGYEALGDLFLELSVIDETKVDSALAVYRLGLARDSTLVDLYNGIAEIYVMKEEIGKADSVYQVALTLFPADLSVQRLWGEFLFKQKRFGEAVEALQPLVERFAEDPNINKLREKLALALAEEKRYSDALVQLCKIVEADPDDVNALLVQGVILAKQRKFKDAVAVLEQALEQDATLAMAHVYIADVRIDQGSYSSAKTHLKQALEIDPGLTVAWVYQGDIARRRGAAQIGGKALSSVKTGNLEAAKSFYTAAKSLYQQGLGSVSFGSYCRSQINHLNQNLELIKKELFIR
jgi:type IV pilus assembly protein PilF